MRYMLDTNVCVHVIRGRSPRLLQKLTEQHMGDVAVSSITVAELQFGIKKSSKPIQNQQALELFLLPLAILDFDYGAAVAYGEIRANLEAQGLGIGSQDTLIAAHALNLGLTLVTNNTREFSRVPKLLLEDWYSWKHLTASD